MLVSLFIKKEDKISQKCIVVCFLFAVCQCESNVSFFFNPLTNNDCLYFHTR